MNTQNKTQRQIKFRGYDNQNKQWVYGYYAKLPDGATKFDYIISDIDGSLTKFYIQDSTTIGQYTGLKDMNGKEIYIGDVICYDYGNPLKKEIPNPKIRTVAFIDGMFVLENDDMHYASSVHTPLNRKVEACEVIGNIYENKKLNLK